MIAIVIDSDREIFHDHRSRRQVIEHSRNRQLRNHIIAVPPGIIYSQTSCNLTLLLCIYHLSMVGQLAHPAVDVGRRAGRHRDRMVNNGHCLQRREQSDNGGVRPYESGVEGGRDARISVGSL